MSTTVGAGWTCQCGAFVPWNTMHACGSYGGAIRSAPSTPKGWECPKCGGVMAPWMAYCHHCKPVAAATGEGDGNG